MIFVTIGTQEPFDRLISAMDKIAEVTNNDVIAQVSASNYVVKHMKSFSFINPKEFNELFAKADLIVSHAGMGSIISALQLGKPIVVMPRKSGLGEHRNDHQMATAKKMESLGYIYVAYDEGQLEDLIVNKRDGLSSLHTLGEWASPKLVSSIRDFIYET